MAKRRDRRGNAERLRQYWTKGKGAVKIRWGQGGDFKRCVRHLGKYLRDPEGYCALRHKAATGIWPGAHGRRRGRR